MLLTFSQRCFFNSRFNLRYISIASWQSILVTTIVVIKFRRWSRNEIVDIIANRVNAGNVIFSPAKRDSTLDLDSCSSTAFSDCNNRIIILRLRESYLDADEKRLCSEWVVVISRRSWTKKIMVSLMRAITIPTSSWQPVESECSSSRYQCGELRFDDARENRRG